MSKSRSSTTGKHGGKTKAWRKIQRQFNEKLGAKVRYGRKFRDAMRAFEGRKPSGYPLLNGLMLLAGLTVVKPGDTITTSLTPEGEAIAA